MIPQAQQQGLEKTLTSDRLLDMYEDEWERNRDRHLSAFMAYQFMSRGLDESLFGELAGPPSLDQTALAQRCFCHGE